MSVANLHRFFNNTTFFKHFLKLFYHYRTTTNGTTDICFPAEILAIYCPCASFKTSLSSGKSRLPFVTSFVKTPMEFPDEVKISIVAE